MCRHRRLIPVKLAYPIIYPIIENELRKTNQLSNDDITLKTTVQSLALFPLPTVLKKTNKRATHDSAKLQF